MKELAEYYNDPHVVCMYAADAEYTGVDMADAKFRAKYCQTASDVSHLNADGMYLVAPKFDKWLAEAYAKFKGATLTNSAEADQFLEVKVPETTVEPEPNAPAETEAPATEPAPAEKGCGGFSYYAIISVIICGACLWKKWSVISGQWSERREC
jgi:hypothetical protein